MKLRAFVRYSKKGKIVPGSLILTNGSYPNGPAVWKEVPADLCCESGLKVALSIPDDLPVVTPYVSIFCGLAPTLVAGAVTGTYTTLEELVVALNAQLSYMGEFSVVDGSIVLAIATDVADVLTNNPNCDGPIIGSITPFGSVEP